ncbi:MAG: alanine glycine permease [Planctomycetaceae bacterium]|nr:alanine glycine permease [Planctomycetaceae bacterium]MBP61629.1 alanine glycine permease [Planctomycetaceae bacterium]
MQLRAGLIWLVVASLLAMTLPNSTALADDDQGSTAAENTAPEKETSLLAQFNDKMFGLLFFDVAFGAIHVDEIDRDGKPVLEPDGKQKQKTIAIPFLVTVLILGAIFFTCWYRFINVRGFKHALDVVLGRYDNPNDEGEISHFRALTSALSATVGLGNIAGVAVAIVLGGPGAVLWMMIAAVFGMTAKFSSCTLSQMYRQVNADGSISGGPMYYLDIGLRKKGGLWGSIGKVLAIMYAIMVMGGALGGGNMFQANQTVEALTSTFGVEDLSLDRARWGIGLVMAGLVAVVILGGIRRIGAATSKIVPSMCCLYVLAAIFVITSNISQLPEALALMVKMAFTTNAFYGGAAGVLIKGVQRAAFSNEAGLGSAAIAHAAAKTDEPVREGLVAMMGPFIDTIIICLMTGLVVVITGTWNSPEVVNADSLQGVAVTAQAFGSVVSWFPLLLTLCVTLFAYSTMISWCYYGERGWIYLMDHFGGAGLRTVVVFRIIFVVFVVIGAVNNLTNVLAFSDIMILSMAFPNIVGSIVLAPLVLERLRDYWGRYTSGEMKAYK